MTSLTDINLLAVLVATVVNMVLGMIWYSPKLFGKAWMKLTGMTDEKAKKGMKKGFALGVLASFLKVYFLAVVLMVIDPLTIYEAEAFGALLVLALLLPGELDGVAWEQRPAKLMWINLGFMAVSVLVTMKILFKMGV